MNLFKDRIFIRTTLLAAALWATVVGCAGEKFFDQLSVSSGMSGYIVVASSQTAMTAPSTVALFDTAGNLVRQLNDYYDSAELASGVVYYSGMIHVLVGGSERVESIDPNTGAYTSQSWSGVAGTLRHMAVDSSGAVYIAESSVNTIEKIAANGSRVGAPFASSSGSCPVAGPSGIAYIPSTDRILVVNATAGGRLSIFNATTGACVTNVNNVAYSANAPQDIVYHPQTNKILVVRSTDSSIYTAAIDGTGPTVAYLNASRVGAPYSIAVDANGYVYVGAATQDTVEKFSFDGTTLTIIGSGPLIGPNVHTQNPTAIAVIP